MTDQARVRVLGVDSFLKEVVSTVLATVREDDLDSSIDSLRPDSLAIVELAERYETTLGVPFPPAFTPRWSLRELYESYLLEKTTPTSDESSRAPTLSGTDSLTGRWTRLRPIRGQDLDFAYHLATVGTHPLQSRLRGATPSPAEFVELMWRKVLAHFVIETRRRDPIGLASIYGASHSSGYAYIALTLEPPYLRLGWPLESLILFLEHTFSNWNFRKLYVDASDFALKAISSGESRFFHEEVTLRAHDYFDGQCWDRHVLAIYRELWQEVRPRALAFCGKTTASLTGEILEPGGRSPWASGAPSHD